MIKTDHQLSPKNEVVIINPVSFKSNGLILLFKESSVAIIVITIVSVLFFYLVYICIQKSLKAELAFSNEFKNVLQKQSLSNKDIITVNVALEKFDIDLIKRQSCDSLISQLASLYKKELDNDVDVNRVYLFYCICLLVLEIFNVYINCLKNQENYNKKLIIYRLI